MISFHQITKILYTYEPKVSKKNSTSCGLFECLKILTHKKIVQLVCLERKVGGNVKSILIF